jgi:competence protein ComEA
MAHRLALVVALLPLLGAASLRAWLRPPPPPPGCSPVALGVPPRHWLGCVAGEGVAARPLADEELLLLGLPLDLNSARPEALAFVPGLSRILAVAVAADRTNRGPFERVDDLRRVSGIGEKRLEKARGTLFVGGARP